MKRETKAAILKVINTLMETPNDFTFNGCCGGLCRISPEAAGQHPVIQGDHPQAALLALYYLLWDVAVYLHLIGYECDGVTRSHTPSPVEVGLRAMEAHR